MTSSERETAANIRGDIQRGRSGDKKPGFDPAAAPMETDGEAGGTPLDEESVRLDRAARIEEIARMLGGVEITELTRRHAGEMLGYES